MSQSWIPFFSGDYDRDTKALSMLEHGAYFNLLRHVWSTGEPIRNHASACRIAYAIASDEQDAVAYILHKFFIETEEGFINQKALKVLAEQAEKSAKAAESANKRWNKSKPKNASGDANAYAKANAIEYANGYANQNQNHNSLLHKEYKSDSKNKKQTQQEPEKYQELAIWFYQELKDRKPQTAEPNQNSWAKTLRLICEADHKSIEEIKESFLWAHDVDSFWGKVCLSPDSLRRNWGKIWAAMDTHTKQKKGNSNYVAALVPEELSFSEKMDLKLERMMKHETWVNRWDSGLSILSKDLNKTGPGTVFHPIHNQIGLNDWIPLESEAVSA